MSSLPHLYSRLGRLIEQGTDTFLADSPRVLYEVAAHRDLHNPLMEPINGHFDRVKVMGEPGAHVLFLVRWPAGFLLPPHEHNGMPGIDYVISGGQAVTDWEATKQERGRYRLTDLQHRRLMPGQHAVVDPRVTEIHSVRALYPTRSLHVYPVDCERTRIYVPDGRYFRRKSMALEKQVLARGSK